LKENQIDGFIDTLSIIRRANKEAPISFPHPLMKTKAGNESLSQTSIFFGCTGKLPSGAHRADSDVLNLSQALSSAPLRALFTLETPIEKITSILQRKEKGQKKPRKALVPCTHCKKKVHRKNNPCPLNKNKKD